jgi:uncharacterized membrane protein YhdT
MARRGTPIYPWALALLLLLVVSWHVAAIMHPQLICQTVEMSNQVQPQLQTGV